MKNKLIDFFLSFHNAEANPFNPYHPRILIISTTGLGDTLWATAPIRSLKKKYPDLYLGLLTTKTGKEIFFHNPDIDEIFIYKNLFSFFSLKKKMKKKRFQQIYIFHASQRIIFPLAKLLNAEKIVGKKFTCKGLDHLLTDLIHEPQIHEVDQRYKQLKELSLSHESRLFFHLTSQEIKEGKKFFLKKNGPIVILHIGSKDSYKCWDQKHYINLAFLMQKKLNAQIYFSDAKKETVTALKKHYPAFRFITGCSLRQFASVLYHSDLLITNDTGPMHLANSLNKKVLSLFSPTDPAVSGPFSFSNAYTIYKKPTCTPCLKRKCLHAVCLDQITVDEVFKKAEQILL